MKISRLIHFLLLALMLLSMAQPPAASAAQQTPPDLGEQGDAVREGTFNALVEEQVDFWTTGGGFLYYARNCITSPDGGSSGIAYLKRRPLGRLSSVSISRQTVTLASFSCPQDGFHAFSSLYADSTGVYYAKVTNSTRTIERRSPSAPAAPIILASYSGNVPGYNGITVGPKYVYWLEQNGAAARMGLAEAFVALPLSRKYMPLGNVGVGEIAYYKGFVFYGAGANLHRVQYICPWFEDACAERPIVSAAGSSMVFGETSTTGLLYLIQGPSVRRITDPVDCPSVCSATLLYTSPSSGGVSWTPTAITVATNPATNVPVLFVKEFERNSCAGGGFAPSFCDARIIRMAGVAIDPIVRLGRPGFLGEQALTFGEVFGPLKNDELALRFRFGGPPSTAWLGGFIYNDIDRLSSTPFSAASINRDLGWIAKMEITQGTQNLAGVTGNVPLVAHRSTVVRVWGNQGVGRPLNAPEAILHGTRNGQPLEGSPLVAIDGPGRIATGAPQPDRGVVNSGWVFALPDSWTEGSISLTTEIDPRHSVTELNLGNNVLTAGATFQKKTAVCIVTIPVRVADVTTPNVSGGPGNVPGFSDALSLFRRMWPTSEVRIYYQTDPVEEREVAPAIIPPRLTKYGPYEMTDDSSKILTALGFREDFTDDPDECDDQDAITYYMGLMGGPPNTVGINGASRETVLYVVMSDGETEPYGTSATTNPPPSPFNVPRAGVTMAHELGHSAGRDHVSCPQPGQAGAPDPKEGIDNGYPLSGNPAQVCSLDLPGFNSTHGLDIGTMTVISPSQAGDLMSYAHRISGGSKPRWPSAYTYGALFNAIQNRAQGIVAEQTLQAAAIDDSTLVVVASGTLLPAQGSGQIEPAVVLPAGPLGGKLRQRLTESSLPISSSLRLRLLDAGGAVLASQPLKAGAAEDSEDLNPPVSFNTVFPAPEGTVAKIDVTNNGAVIATRDVGPAAPTVNLLSPAGGETIKDTISIGFTANDADPGDYLVYTIQYSADLGKHWQAISANRPAVAPNGTYNFSLATGELPGTAGKTALIRVLASDGYHTAIATSAPFSMENHAPVVSIAAPNGGAPIPAGALVQLLGEATDIEDGSVASLTWQVDGLPAGSGNIAHAAGLTTGEHTATLTATDSAGLTGTATRTFRVDPLRIPDIAADLAPSIDGYCDDDGYLGANRLPLEQANSFPGRGIVNLARLGNTLYVCFNNLEIGALSTPPDAYLRFDTGPLDTPVDYRFVLNRAGTPTSLSRVSRGSSTVTSAGNLLGRVRLADNEAVWSAEMQIDIASLGGWGNLRKIHFSEVGMTDPNEARTWPHNVGADKPEKWADLNVAGTDLAVTLGTTALTPPSGSVMTYTISIANTGPAAAPATVTLTLPGAVTAGAPLPSSGACSDLGGGKFSCALGDLPVGAIATIVVPVQVTGAPGAPLDAQAVVASSINDANSANNTAAINGSVYRVPQSNALGAPTGGALAVFLPAIQISRQ